jgi:hypothetical protein
VETEVANAIKQHLGRQARAPPFVKLAEDRQHTPDVSEAVEGNGGVTFYRALLLVLAALKFPSPWSWWAAQGTTLQE